MIGRLYGKIEYRSDDHLLLDVQGVGYVVYCSERTLRALPAVGEYTFLYTDLLVREDLLQLFFPPVFKLIPPVTELCCAGAKHAAIPW